MTHGTAALTVRTMGSGQLESATQLPTQMGNSDTPSSIGVGRPSGSVQTERLSPQRQAHDGAIIEGELATVTDPEPPKVPHPRPSVNNVYA